jgi:hypothetical protein
MESEKMYLFLLNTSWKAVEGRNRAGSMIKFLIIPALFLVLSGAEAAGGDVLGCRDSTKTPNTEAVLFGIGGNALSVPVGRIMLIRKRSKYCAVKFTEAWQGEAIADCFANYESYYQGDGSGDLSKANVKYTADQLIERRVVSRFRQLPGFLVHLAGPQNLQVKCGSMKLGWSGCRMYLWICFNEHVWTTGDHGIELAATKWTDISQVNVFDPRLRWYGYEAKRKRVYIPIDQLWEDGEDQK